MSRRKVRRALERVADPQVLVITRVTSCGTSSLLAVVSESFAGEAQGRRLLSPYEVAAYLGVPLATVYRWRSRREGPIGIRVGRHVRYRVGDVERWLDQQRDTRS